MAWYTTQINATSPAIVDEQQPTQHFTVGQTFHFELGNEMYMKFVLPDELLYKKFDVTNSYLYIRNNTYDGNYGSFSGLYRPLAENYDESTVTYITRPQAVGGPIKSYLSVDEPPYIVKFPIYHSYYSELGRISPLKAILDFGVKLLMAASYNGYTYTPNSSYKPYIEFNYSDDTSFYTIGGLYPAQTYKTKDTRFGWNLFDSESGYATTEANAVYTNILFPPSQTSATLKWRTAAGSTEHSVTVATDNHATIPANTFTTDTVEWMVTATYSNGMTLSSDWRTISTVDSVPSVTAQSPRNTTIDGSMATTFVWNYSNDSGSLPTGYTLQSSTDGSTWTTFSENLNTDAVTYNAPANTFTAGQMYWRVKGYNVDGVGSAWSAAISNIVISPPQTPSVSVDTTTPYPVITWQTIGQQGFEIEVDGASSGVKFGTSQNYKWPEALADGVHSVRVRAQNIYSIWSEWGSATFTVTNVPNDDITLSANAGNSVRLTWATDGAYDRYIIYRDGVKIAETTSTDYNDYRSVGSMTYTVRGIYGNYYTMSNAVNATVVVDGVIIRAEDGNEWISLKLVADSDRHNTISHTQNVSYQHYSGATYPMATIGTTRDYVYSFAVAFKEIDECRRFEELLGKVVTLKDGWENCVTGALDGYSVDSSRFYQSYICTIRQVE